MTDHFIRPHWPAPASIRAAVTTRAGGVSQPPCDSLNLGAHVGDDAAAVARNRQLLVEQLGLPAAPLWLQQVHGVSVVDAAAIGADQSPQADAVWVAQPERVLAVMIADCLPVLLASRCGSVIAAIHGGWRGLAGGIVDETIAALPTAADQLIAWLGPAIGPDHFEVGGDVLEAFATVDRRYRQHFVAREGSSDKYLADIFALARATLRSAGVTQVSGGGLCTVSDPRFFSHRRDAGATGRMAALIWRSH